MQKYVAMGVWGLIFGLVGLFLLSQSLARPRPSPGQPISPESSRPAPTTRAHAMRTRPVPTTRLQPLSPTAQVSKSSAPVKKSAPPPQTTAATSPPTRLAAQSRPSPSASALQKTPPRAGTPSSSNGQQGLPPLLIGFYVFLLAIFLGFELISKVPPTLHTPLMSGSNAISGITIIGALYCARTSSPSVATILGLLAVIFAMINVVGGYLVTDRMLRMFRK